MLVYNSSNALIDIVSMKVCNNKLENESGYVPKSFSLSYLVPKTYYVSETINANYYGYLSIILC